MSNKIDISLDSISSLIDGLNNLNNDLDKIANEICKEVVADGSKYLEDLYSRRKKDDNITDINVKNEINNNGGKIIAYGKDVVYEEFGTGDRGVDKPHPMKDKFNINNYNSGGTITNINQIHDDKILDVLESHGITEGNFWFYSTHNPGSSTVQSMTTEQKLNRAKYLIDHDNEVILSQGIPSGQEVWKTRNYLLDNRYKRKLAKKGKKINDYIVTTIKK